jgi:hypothetical protein
MLNAKGDYSVESAYPAQFIGSHPDYQWEKKIWNAEVENKCAFFTCFLVQRKFPMADKIVARSGRANLICQLCSTTQGPGT